MDDVDAELERRIVALLAARADAASICPSEAARAAAGRLAGAGEVEVTQGGAVVDVGTARGPVRIRRPR